MLVRQPRFGLTEDNPLHSKGKFLSKPTNLLSMCIVVKFQRVRTTRKLEVSGSWIFSQTKPGLPVRYCCCFLCSLFIQLIKSLLHLLTAWTTLNPLALCEQMCTLSQWFLNLLPSLGCRTGSPHCQTGSWGLAADSRTPDPWLPSRVVYTRFNWDGILF